MSDKQNSYIFAGLYALVASIVIAIVIVMVCVIKSDGAVQYCYIDSTSVQGVPQTFHKLHGYRPWRTDTTMGIFGTFDEAVTAANLAQCPFTKK